MRGATGGSGVRSAPTVRNVCEVDHAAGTFNFMLIAFTQEKVVIAKKAVGDFVNLEVDVISKYVEQSLQAVLARVDALEKRLDEQSKCC